MKRGDDSAGLECPTCGDDLRFIGQRPMKAGEVAVARCARGHPWDVRREADGSLMVVG